MSASKLTTALARADERIEASRYRPEPGDIVGEVLTSPKSGIFERWACENDECPARPAWDRALTDAWDAAVSELERKWEDAAREVIAGQVAELLRAHPDLPLRESH